MSFASRITRLPCAYNKDAGQAVQAVLPDWGGELRQLIEGTAGSSPYLKSLIEKESSWLPEALDAPEDSLQLVYAQLREAPPDRLMGALRQAKRRVALLVALADIAGAWTLEDITTTLTDFADLACTLALQEALRIEIRRGRLPDLGSSETSGMVCLAMGKMGAHELNYSSDIDLICLFDESRFDPDSHHTLRNGFVRATRKMVAILQDHTADGYVFRTDLRLRPDPLVTPVCIAIGTAESYYEVLGRTWERAAFIKARPAAGDIATGEQFLRRLTPFVWRRYLDFAAIEDAHNMRLRIRRHQAERRSLSATSDRQAYQGEALRGYDIKLGYGGIRDIEFFTQTRQIISGGRDPDLRERGTLAALGQLVAKGWVSDEIATRLGAHYRTHRELEHRIQMIEDAQTQSLPRSSEGLQRVACLMGQSAETLCADLGKRLAEVHEITEGFFTSGRAASVPSGAEAEPPPSKAAPDVAPEPALELDEDTLQRWYGYPALNSERAVRLFNHLQPELMRHVAATDNPQQTLLALDGFLAALPAGVQLFSLLHANPQLLDLLIDIAGTSPALALYLSRNSGVFDAVIEGRFFEPWPGLADLKDALAQNLAREDDYEHKLDVARRWAKEWHFRIGVHHLRGLIGSKEAGTQYADLAEACLEALWPEVMAQFALRHGQAPGRGAVVLGMGSLGARQMSPRSDLDLLVLYDADEGAFSTGRKPLAARGYYARLTQMLITALSAPMAQGYLYKVDMRLRPSGQAGPVAISLASFCAFQRTRAEIWEHLALTRARAVAGPQDLRQQIAAFRREIITRPHQVPILCTYVLWLRNRIEAGLSPQGPWDVKIGGGRLRDIELLAQAAALLHGHDGYGLGDALASGVAGGWMASADCATLQETYDLLWQVQMAARLLEEGPLSDKGLGAGGIRYLLRECGAATLLDLSARIAAAAKRSTAIIERQLRGD
ncbi:MAG: bifunctional [glutamine synthetase] adenylyltransferase/[glutamine synthetase]-adenylyl-L-tyrosine phosphorylase [Rhodobacteraceae bacterium]|nr:bifunctional [glutamine synthetase] adenylyltransferase/[glutamine synthetase]-adenylyl-L-tyrosine phosphorylase [Paracoccaceae bacterium]